MLLLLRHKKAFVLGFSQFQSLRQTQESSVRPDGERSSYFSQLKGNICWISKDNVKFLHIIEMLKNKSSE